MDTSKLTIEQTKKLNEIASELKKDYVDFINQCCSDKQGDIYWWMTPFANRNNTWDDTFKKLCILLLSKYEIENNNILQITVDSKGIVKTLKKIYSDRQVKITYSNRVRAFDKIIQIILSYRTVIQKNKYVKKHFKNKVLDNRIDIALVSHILSSNVNNENFSEGYFGNIDDYTEKPLYYIPWLVKSDNSTWNVFIENIKKIPNRQYIFLELYSKWYDIFFFIAYIIKCHIFASKKYYFKGIDISSIIRESLLNYIVMIRTYCDYKAFDRLTRDFSINKLIIWYEARPLDNVMAMIYRKNNLTGKCIGYIGTPISEFFLGHRIIHEQQRQNAFLDLIAVTGKKYIDEIKEFNTGINVITAPCFRNRYYKVKKVYHDKFTVLAAMSYYSEDIAVMINILNHYCCEASDITINIKMHPANSTYTIEHYCKDKISFTPNYVTGKLIDCVAEADVVFTSRSASSMEVICGGIPLICLCMPGELLDTSIAKEVSKDAYDIIYDAEDFAKAIERIKSRKKNNSQSDIININPQDYFIEPTRENVKAFLEA